MNKIVEMRPVIDIHNFENLIAQKLGYEDKDDFRESLRNGEYPESTVDKVRDHIGWWITDEYGNQTYLVVDVLDSFRADWSSENDYYFDMTEEEVELFNKIDRTVIKLVEDGEIPDEFILHVWW